MELISQSLQTIYFIVRAHLRHSWLTSLLIDFKLLSHDNFYLMRKKKNLYSAYGI